MPSRVTQEERTCSYGRSGTTKIAGGRRPGCLAEYTATKESTPIAEQCVTVAPATQEGRPDQLQTQAEGEFMGNLEGLVRMVKELTVETTNLVNELKHVDAALAVLGNLDRGSSYTKPRRTLSASARKKISLAQKARWQKVRKGSKPA